MKRKKRLLSTQDFMRVCNRNLTSMNSDPCDLCKQMGVEGVRMHVGFAGSQRLTLVCRGCLERFILEFNASCEICCGRQRPVCFNNCASYAHEVFIYRLSLVNAYHQDCECFMPKQLIKKGEGQ